jgi:hypothetical protein
MRSGMNSLAVAGPSASGIALLITKMVCQLGAQRPLEQRLLQLLEQAFLARRMVVTSRSDGELPVTDFCLICAPR